jgi:hypothetical protein
LLGLYIFDAQKALMEYLLLGRMAPLNPELS